MTLPGARHIAVSRSDVAARVAIGCVPVMALFPFSGGGLSDAASIVVALMALPEYARDRSAFRSAPAVLALVWVGYVVLSAILATAQGADGRPFGNVGKHLTVAYAPFAAIALSAALTRLRWSVDAVAALFFGSLLIGGCVLVLRNGALSALFEGRALDMQLGRVNRNYAALCCGLGIVSAVGLIQVGLTRARRTAWTIAAAIVLAIVALALTALLALLGSRGAFAATAIAINAFLLTLAVPAWLRDRADRRKQAWLAAAILMGPMIALAAGGLLAAGGRLAIKGSIGETVTLIGQLAAAPRATAGPALGVAEERVQLIAIGLDLVRQRPWLGWGPDVWTLLGLQTDFPLLKALTQFHNGYLQHLVSFGFVGSALMLAYLGALLRSALGRREHGDDPMAPGFVAAAVALGAYLAVFNATESVQLIKCAAIAAMMLATFACLRRPARSSATAAIRLPASPR